MAIYRQIYIKFWNDDAKVADEFTPEDKYFYLYLLTNPHTNLCGCYEISFKAASRETGYNEDTIRRLMDRMQRTHNVIRFDEETREVLIPNWHKYNWTKSKDLLKSVREQASLIKSESFRNYILGLADGETVIPPSYDGGETSVYIPVTDTVSVTDIEKKPKKFSPPSVEEVRAYCEERGNGVDAEKFVAYYSSQQWRKANGQRVSDWKACVRTWESKDKPKEKTEEKMFDIEEYGRERGWWE